VRPITSPDGTVMVMYGTYDHPEYQGEFVCHDGSLWHRRAGTPHKLPELSRRRWHGR
jgi:hypothetical protein